MKLIPLRGKHGVGKFATVDDEDYEFLMQWNWRAAKGKRTFYAVRGKIYGETWMHRLLNKTPNGIMTDHKDRDGLNNQKENLRDSDKYQNGSNRRARKDGASKYLGVTRKKQKKVLVSGEVKYYYMWYAAITVNGKSNYISDFPYTEEGERSAALAYNEAAIKYHGEFANLNIVENQTQIIDRKFSSDYIGVFANKKKNKIVRFMAAIRVKNERIYIGTFPPTKEGERMAALAYNKKAIELNGDKAKINVI